MSWSNHFLEDVKEAIVIFYISENISIKCPHTSTGLSCYPPWKQPKLDNFGLKICPRGPRGATTFLLLSSIFWSPPYITNLDNSFFFQPRIIKIVDIGRRSENWRKPKKSCYPSRSGVRRSWKAPAQPLMVPGAPPLEVPGDKFCDQNCVSLGGFKAHPTKTSYTTPVYYIN